MIKAAIDVGSNSILLLVSELIDGQWVPLREISTVTALGEGTKETGLLNEARMSSTLEVLRNYQAVCDDMEVNECLIGGTMALRIAQNAKDFLSRADDQGTPVRVLTGDQEAELGFLAVANDPLFANDARLSIIDPGGHSTELMTADREPEGNWRIKFRQSFAVGALGLRGTIIPDETPDFAQRLNAMDQIDSLLSFDYLPGQSGRAVVLGATGTNLISIREGYNDWLPNLVHGQILDFEEISRAVGWLCDMTDAQRSQIVGLEKGREKTIHLGALILERFMQSIHVLEVTVSIRGWRHALIESGWPS